jgi:hypothetical protein
MDELLSKEIINISWKDVGTFGNIIRCKMNQASINW